MAKVATTGYAQVVSGTTHYYVQEPYEDVQNSKFGKTLGLKPWDDLSDDEKTAWTIFYASCAHWVIQREKEGPVRFSDEKAKKVEKKCDILV